MTQKFFRPKNSNNNINLTPVVIAPEDKTTEEDVEVLEAQIKKMNQKLKEPTKPQRPAKRKPHKRVIAGPLANFKEWSSIVKSWAASPHMGVETVFEDDVDRVDVIGDNWRICVSAFANQEFMVTLFFNYKTGFNSKRISVEYIKQPEIITALNFLLEAKEKFKGDTNG